MTEINDDLYIEGIDSVSPFEKEKDDYLEPFLSEFDDEDEDEDYSYPVEGE